MKDLYSSPYFGIALSILTFWAGSLLQKKTRKSYCNPLIISIALTICVLIVFQIPYEDYNQGGQIINMFLVPATTCLAVSIYMKKQILKEYWLPVLIGCTTGSLVSMGSVYGLCRLFGLNQKITMALIPKSVTTPIAVSISESHQGIVSITVMAVILTGVLGSILSPFLIKLFHVTDAVEAGLSIGACSHAVGTSKALEIGETEGAMSGLAIGVCGFITVLISIIFLH